MKNTEAWWVCSCGAKINRVGKPQNLLWENHLKVCPIKADNDVLGTTTYRSLGMYIKQIKQGK